MELKGKRKKQKNILGKKAEIGENRPKFGTGKKE
jgi:hypothetical protein